jgi:hypothetical protein
MNHSGIFWIRGLDEMRLKYLSVVQGRLRQLLYYYKNLDKIRAYYWKRRDYYVAYCKLYRIKNREILRAKGRIRDTKYRRSGRAIAAYHNNIEARRATKREWERKNKDKRKLQNKIRLLKKQLEKKYGHTLKK